MTTDPQRKANNALGVCIIALVMLLESAFAHHKRPSAASPWVWSVLGIVAVVSLATWLKFRHKGAPPKP